MKNFRRIPEKVGYHAGASLVGLVHDGALLESCLQQSQHGSRARALCIGTGGGSLPMFLAHHFPGMQVASSCTISLHPMSI